MKHIIILFLFTLFVANACEKDKEKSLKETIELTIVNQTNNEYLDSKLIALTASETHSDSIKIEIPSNDSVSISWNPKLSTSTGTFYFKLDNNRGLDLWYYAGYSISDDGPFKLTINESEIIYE
jgi:hypothetical protein